MKAERAPAGLPGDREGRRLSPEDYALPAPRLAPFLLGKLLCRAEGGGAPRRLVITETEAYCGAEDSACHARFGQTARNAPMFRAGGCLYVYLCYGIHWMLNVVSGREGRGEAVLLRGVEGFPGPGRLTKALGIDRTLNGEDLRGSDRIWIEDGGLRPAVSAGPRVGIGYATPEDRARPWRFVLRTPDQNHT